MDDFNIGSRVFADEFGFTGNGTVIATANSRRMGVPIYLVDMDEDGTGLHNGGAETLTGGAYGTSNNCVWFHGRFMQALK